MFCGFASIERREGIANCRKHCSTVDLLVCCDVDPILCGVSLEDPRSTSGRPWALCYILYSTVIDSQVEFVTMGHNMAPSLLPPISEPHNRRSVLMHVPMSTHFPLAHPRTARFP